MTNSGETTSTTPFEFLDTGPLADAELTLELADGLPEDPHHDRVPCYKFHMIRRGRRTRMGNISLRIDYTDLLVKNAGQIGYGIRPEYRRNRYPSGAASSSYLWPTGTDSIPLDNIASRRSCVLVGARYFDTTRHRSSNPMHPSSFSKNADTGSISN